MKNRDEKKDIRTFGVGFTVIFLVIGSYQLYKGYYNAALWLYLTAGLILPLSILTPFILKPAYIVLTTISHKIGWLNTRILLGIIFYLVFTPISLIYRLIGRDPLERQIEKEKKSYWIPRRQFIYDKSRYEKQF